MHVNATRGRIATSTGNWRAAWQFFARVLAPFKISIGRGAVDAVDVLVALLKEEKE